MNGLSLIAALALFHATIVVIATLAVRFCIPRQHTAARAAVSSVGMACILFVSVFALLPVPSVWTHSESGAVMNVERAIDPIPEAERLNNDSLAVGASHETSSANPTFAVEVSTAWFRQMSAGLNRAIDAASTTTSSWPVYLALILLGGTAIGAFRIGIALLHVRRLHRTSIPIVDQTILKQLNQLKGQCNCRRTIELRESTDLASAATFGLRKPVILLSTSWRHWSPDELAAVLAHELAHIHRADYLHRLLAELTAAIHFCHPLVRAAARRLRADQEFAADRLASSLSASKEAYLRGFAELALRFHDSFQGDERWSNVSIMPRSSDFLVRRLHMLRTKDGSIDKRRSRLVSACAALGIVSIALATTLLRSSSSLAAKPDSSAAQAAEDLQKSEPEQTNDKQQQSDAKAAKDETVEPLFDRGKFDLSLIHNADEGLTLIRVREFMSHPEVAPLAAGFNKNVTDFQREWAKIDAEVDLREIEWIALCTNAKYRELPAADVGKNGETSLFAIGAGYSYIRMAHAANWKEVLLNGIPESKLESFEGHEYVHLEPIAFFGPVGCRVRVLDDRTLVIAVDSKPEDLEASNKMFFDDKPRAEPYAWENAWHAVEGGVITCVYDHAKSGYSELPEAKRHEVPESLRPLAEKVHYYAAGLDCTEKTRHAGIRIRGTCADQNAVQQLHLATSLALNRWPELFQSEAHVDRDIVAAYYPRILKFFSGIKIQPSAPDSDQHFVQVEGDGELKEGELTKVLPLVFDDL